jgi:hypothetical protein
MDQPHQPFLSQTQIEINHLRANVLRRTAWLVALCGPWSGLYPYGAECSADAGTGDDVLRGVHHELSRRYPLGSGTRVPRATGGLCGDLIGVECLACTDGLADQSDARGTSATLGGCGLDLYSRCRSAAEQTLPCATLVRIAALHSDGGRCGEFGLCLVHVVQLTAHLGSSPVCLTLL